MDNIFARFILGEAAPPTTPPSPTSAPTAQKQEPKMEIPGADKSLQPPDEPPDLTQDPAANTGGTPDAGAGDPTASGDTPPEGGEGDPAAQDPNAAGVEDPTAGGAPAGMGGPTIQSPEAQIEQDEKDTFSDLKPEQMIIMKAELRDNYKELYKLIIDTLDKINKISHTTYDDTMLDFIVRKFVGLKTQIKDTLVDTFSTRTYIANKIELSRYTFIFNQLTNMLTQIYQSRLKRQQKVQELNKTNTPKHDAEEFPLFSRGYDTH